MSSPVIPDDPESLPDLSKLSPAARREVLKRLKEQEAFDLHSFYCDYPGRSCDGMPHEGFPYNHARADQWPPPGADWFIWLLMGGRGSGKTRTGAEYTRQVSKAIPQISLIGQTAPAVRDVMIEDPKSGIIRVFENYGERVRYEPTKRRIMLPNGAIVRVFSAEEPDRLRGPQHGFIWMDEAAHFPKVEDVWDMALMGLRQGVRPHVLLTTTPLPTKWMKDRIAESTTRVVRVSTRKNLMNLAPTTRQQILSRYEGTRLGRQELDGELLEDVEGALWQMDLIQMVSSAGVPSRDEFDRIVIGVDPAGSVKRKSDQTGIVVAGRIGTHVYVLEDLTGDIGEKRTPQEWANVVDRAAHRWKADAVVVERNYGGDLVRANLKSVESEARIIEVVATRGKKVRAEPIVSFYEQKRVSHAPGLGLLEDEMTTWVPDLGDPSPNRLDALVWCVADLLKGSGVASVSVPRGRIGSSQPRATIGASRRGVFRR